MVVGEHNKETDLVVKVSKGKKLSNMRTVSSDDTIRLEPPRIMSLEQCLEYLAADELAEITPDAIRIRKKLLKEEDRKKQRKIIGAV